MAVSQANTDLMIEHANSIIQLASDYEVIVTQLFKRFSEVPYITKEWVGEQSEYYFNTIMLDKNEYVALGEEIKKYAKKILRDAEDIDDEIIKVKKEESSKEYY